MAQSIQNLAQQRAFGFEIESILKLVVIEKAAADGGRRFEHRHRQTGVKPFKVSTERLRRFAACPVAGQSRTKPRKTVPAGRAA